MKKTCWPPYQIGLVYTRKSSWKRLHFAKLHDLPNFYPNLPIFLHEYIRHIRDISQLWFQADTAEPIQFVLCRDSAVNFLWIIAKNVNKRPEIFFRSPLLRSKCSNFSWFSHICREIFSSQFTHFFRHFFWGWQVNLANFSTFRMYVFGPKFSHIYTQYSYMSCHIFS